MQEIIASPNGPVLQAVPGALLDLSWPNASYEGLRRGGLPGIVAMNMSVTKGNINSSGAYENQRASLEPLSWCPPIREH